MTGRDLIIYIMQNNLEDEVVIETINEGAAAVKFGVGINSIRLWYKLGLLKGWELKRDGYTSLAIFKDAPDPREKVKNHG